MKKACTQTSFRPAIKNRPEEATKQEKPGRALALSTLISSPPPSALAFLLRVRLLSSMYVHTPCRHSSYLTLTQSKSIKSSSTATGAATGAGAGGGATPPASSRNARASASPTCC